MVLRPVVSNIRLGASRWRRVRLDCLDHRLHVHHVRSGYAVRL